MRKRLLVVISGLLIASAALSGCGQKKDTKAEAATNKFTWWVSLYSHVGQTADNFADTAFYQELMRRTNTQIEFIHPAPGQETEDFNLMLATKELPDIIERDFLLYKGGPQKAVDDGIIIELDPYLKSDAPNYSKLLKEHPDWDKQVKLDSGKHYTFAFLRGDDSLTYWSGPQIRADLLQKAGLPLPETIGEWEQALKAFQEMGIKYPLSITGVYTKGMFIGAYGVAKEYYLDGGMVKYGPLQQGYRDFIELFRRWYREGLLDPDFFMQDAKTLGVKILNGNVGAFIGSAGGDMGRYLRELPSNVPGASLSGTKYAVLQKGDIPRLAQNEFNYVPNNSVSVTTACENPKDAIRFLDYNYSEEGYMLNNFGIEGVSYVMENGYPAYTDLITNNPDGLPMIYAMGQYMASCYGGPFVQDKRYYEQYLQMPEQREAVALWEQQDTDGRIPAVTFTTAEAAVNATKGSELTAYVDENTLKFITGQLPMEKYDEFQEMIHKLGVQEMLDIYQAALDRYQSR